MSQQEQAEPQEISSQEMADIMNGSAIADEVDKPPSRSAKASVVAQDEPEDEDDTEVTPDLKELARKHLEASDDEEEDEPSPLGGGLYKKLLEKTKSDYEASMAELNEKVATLEKRAALADLSLEGLREAALAGKLTKGELIELASDLFYIAEPERADPDTKVGLERKKLSIEQRKMRDQLEAQEREIQERAEQAQREITTQKMEIKYVNEVAKALDDFPHIAAAFDNDAETLGRQVLDYATAVAMSVKDKNGQVPDLSPLAVLKLFEEIAEAKHTKLQSNKRLSKKKSAAPVSAPSAPKTHDEEVEEMVRIMNSYK